MKQKQSNFLSPFVRWLSMAELTFDYLELGWEALTWGRHCIGRVENEELDD